MSNGIVIQQYEQQHVPNAGGMPTQSGPAPGETIGRAVADFGGAVAGLGRANLELQDRNAKIEAAKILSDAEVMIAEQKQAAALALGDKDPTGFAGTFNEQLDKMREGVVSKAGDQQNPFLKQHLDTGFMNLQRNTFLDNMRVEYEATGKFRGNQVKGLAENATKIVALTPGKFEEQSAMVIESIDAMTGVSAAWKEEAKKGVRATLASSALMSITKTDSAKAMEIMKNKDDPLVAALGIEEFTQLKEKVRVEYITDEGKRIGDEIGLTAASMTEAISKISKIADPDIRAIAEQNALQTYSQKTSAKREAKENAERAWYNEALKNLETLPPFPASMDLADRKTALDVVNQYKYVAAGGVTRSDPSTYMMLWDMKNNNPAAFAKENLDKHVGGLSQGDLLAFKKMQSTQASQRTAVGDDGLNALLTDAMRQMMPPLGKDAGPPAVAARKQQEFAFVQGFVEAVNIREEKLGRPMEPKERQAFLNEFVRFRATNPPEPYDPYGLVSGGGTSNFMKAVPGRYPQLIPRQLQALGVDPTPENIVKFYQGVEANRDAIIDGLEEQGIEPTDDNIVAAHAYLLRKQ